MRLLAPAKINLHLRVGRRRDDGFHPLLTWMCTVGLFDTLTLTRGDGERSAVAVSLHCDRPDLPTDERNLVVRVAKAFAAEVTAAGPVAVGLEKRVPVGAGLGGGSSDAAATLLGLNHLWGANWPADRLSAFAAKFGSDAPFFLHGPSSACRGRGEIVRPVARPAPAWALLVMPSFGLATRDVYGRFDEMGLGADDELAEDMEPDWHAWARLDAGSLMARAGNDLEPAAFSVSPALARLRKSLEERLGRVVRMSGSGSTLFTLYDAAEERDARAVADDLRGEGAVGAAVVSVAIAAAGASAVS